jgi:hypothetical protein
LEIENVFKWVKLRVSFNLDEGASELSDGLGSEKRKY